MTKGHVCWRALLAAFPYTTPILAGFAFLGFAYGVYMNVMGFPFYEASSVCVEKFPAC